MPELPEVQTIIGGLKEKVIGKKIELLKEFRSHTVLKHTSKTELGKIISLERRGKYIVLQTSNNLKIIIHLRMTGKLIYQTNSSALPAHTRAVFIFSDNSELIFNDTRAFGKIEIYNRRAKIAALEKLGPEPLSEDFNENYLKTSFSGRTSPVKNLLLNQKIVAGIGNIYACEILYRAKVNPLVSGKSLSIEQLQNIARETKMVLKEAILHNGTTISDYRNVDDKTGEFQNFLRVYQKEKCPKGHQIRRVKQAGRSTYYCPMCQQSTGGLAKNPLNK
jgi:formamidopyrimidine-DNA glycosylase